MSLKPLFPLFAAVLLALPVFAGITDYAITLAGSGVSDDVMIAWAQRQHDFTLSAQDIIRLRDAKLADNVIVQLIRASNESTLADAPRETRKYSDTPVARE